MTDDERKTAAKERAEIHLEDHRRWRESNKAAARDFRERMRAAWREAEYPITQRDAPL